MDDYTLIKLKGLLTFVCAIFLQPANLCAQDFTFLKTGQGVEISENGKKILFYQNQPKSLDGKYERAGYVHPLYDLNGKILTENSPEDHPYHRGIFWAWHQIIIGDKKIADGWTSENIKWEPRGVKIKKHKESIALESDLLWKCVLQHNEPRAVIKEHTTITAYKSTHRYRLIDFDIMLTALVDSLQIGGSEDLKGYGGFCLRLKLPDDLLFVSNDSAITPIETAVSAGPWMNITGSFNGASFSKAGITILCGQPVAKNRQPWILRNKTSMQNVPYPGRTPIDLPLKGLSLHYRIVIHNGDMSSGQLEKLYQEYIHTL